MFPKKLAYIKNLEEHVTAISYRVKNEKMSPGTCSLIPHFFPPLPETPPPLLGPLPYIRDLRVSILYIYIYYSINALVKGHTINVAL